MFLISQTDKKNYQLGLNLNIEFGSYTNNFYKQGKIMEPLKQSHTPIDRREIIPRYLAILSWLKKSSNKSRAKIVLPCF